MVAAQNDTESGKIPENAIMRCRWLFVWKSPNGSEDPSELSKDGKKAKARRIVIGYEGPKIDEVVNDAPTLSKDGRMVVLQGVASHQRPLISFDISTAFLRGKGMADLSDSSRLQRCKMLWKWGRQTRYSSMVEPMVESMLPTCGSVNFGMSFSDRDANNHH